MDKEGNETAKSQSISANTRHGATVHPESKENISDTLNNT